MRVLSIRLFDRKAIDQQVVAFAAAQFFFVFFLISVYQNKNGNSTVYNINFINYCCRIWLEQGLPVAYLD